MTAPTMPHRWAAEFVGTFLLVFGGCGAAVLAANPAGDHTVGIGYLGVALAFGLALLAAVYAFGNISGGHFNPAVTLGAAVAGRVEWEIVLRYWVAQVLGGLAAGGAIYLIAGGRPKLESGWPPAFSQLLSQCWHQDSAQRPSFVEISARLGQMMETEKSSSGKGSGGTSVLRRVSGSMFGLKGSQKS